MAEKTTQTLANHGRLDPPFHFFMLPIGAIALIGALRFLYLYPARLAAWWLLLLCIGAIVSIFKIRLYALRNQDRIIRLEERLRLMTVLREPLRSRVNELNEAQLIALRFAPDAELTALVERTLNEKLTRTEIKKAIQQWRPDHFRV